MLKHLATLLVAGTALYAAEADPMAEATDRLLQALEQEVEALENIGTAADAPAAVEAVRASLQTQKKLFEVDVKELWLYIDNTEGVKQPLVDVMVRLAVQFKRLSENNYFDNAALRELLAPQIVPDEASGKAKLEKMRTIDHDED